MIHGKWLKGSDDLSALSREITEQDRFSWHLIVEDEGKVSRCSLTPYNNSFCIRELMAANDTATELMLRMVGAKLDTLGKVTVYASTDKDFSSFGFKPYKEGILKAEQLSLPRHCKG